MEEDSGVSAFVTEKCPVEYAAWVWTCRTRGFVEKRLSEIWVNEHHVGLINYHGNSLTIAGNIDHIRNGQQA